MKYIALTGATGLLGSYLLKDLLRRDIPVLTLIRSSRRESAKQRIEGILRRFEAQLGRSLPRPVIMESDLHKPELGLNKAQIHWISQHVESILHNAASLTFVADENGEPYASNVKGMQHVLQLCQSANIRKFYHVSTCYVCGLRQGVVLESELDEGQEFGNDYEKSKVEAEKMVRSCRFIDSLTVFRPAIIVGDRHTGYTPTFHGFYAPIKIVLPFADPVKTTDNDFAQYSAVLGMKLSDRKNFVPVDWISQVMTHVISHPEHHDKTYHLSAANRVKIEEMGKVIIEGIKKYVKRDAAHPGISADFDQILSTFSGQMGVYKAYWKDDPEFDMTNTIQAAPHLPPPMMTHDLLLTLVRYAMQSNCGWPLPKPTVLENDVQTVFDAYDKNDFQIASDHDGFTFSLRVTGRGGGDWTINQNNGRIGIYQGLSSFADVPLMSMNTDTFNKLQTSSDSDLFWNVSWENAPVEHKAKAVQALREVKSKVAGAK
ncbi:MAG: SDR family oxidoreductase [Thermoguttaceae bacterium]|nr:SDR family oxidoreductase [Thermoguttaceae bacterium]